MSAGNRIIRFLNLMIGSKDMTQYMEETDQSIEDLIAALEVIDGESQINAGSIPPGKLQALVPPGITYDAFALTYNHTAGKFEWQDISAVVGADTYMVKWDAGDPAEHLESKFPNPSTMLGDEFLKANVAGDAYELASLATVFGIIAGDALKSVRVKADETGFDFKSVLDLPEITITDALKPVRVNSTGDGFDIGSVPIVPITVDTTIYLDVTGNDTTGEGTLALPWYSPAKAFDYLKDKWVNTDVLLTVSAAVGNYVDLAEVIVNHSCANRIQLIGADEATTVFNFTAGGITIDGVGLYNINGFTIKGDLFAFSSSGISVKNNGFLKGNNVTIDTWASAMKLVHATMLTNSLTITACTENITGDNVSGEMLYTAIDCVSTAMSVKRSNIDISYSSDTGAPTIGFKADENSFLTAVGVTSTATTTFSPPLNTEDNIRSYIYQP